jgi:hypothetical protein
MAACGDGGRTRRADHRPAISPVILDARHLRASHLNIWRLAFAATVDLLASCPTDVAEPRPVNKPRKLSARAIADVAGRCVGRAFSRQGFTSVELITRWEDIVGQAIAIHAEPVKIQWSRQSDPDDAEPATLVLRVEGPTILEIQHLSNVILERVNSFLGYRAVGRLALRQAPLQRTRKPMRPRPPDPASVSRIVGQLADIADQDLRTALGRLGAAIKRT